MLIFSDGRAWSVGVDGGRKDGREFKLTQGEHLTRVTHESLKQRFVSCISEPVLKSASHSNRHHCCISVINNVIWQHNVKTTSGASSLNVFVWRWYAGASIEFETNKGRIISFHPYLATRFERMSKFICWLKMTILRQKDKEVTIRASPGQEIIMLKIK